MATVAELSKVVRTLPNLVSTLGHKKISLHYDDEADVLYIHLGDSIEADDSEMIDDNLVIRYRNGKMVGITVMNARGYMS